MAFCKNCGGQLSKTAKFCGVCGDSLSIGGMLPANAAAKEKALFKIVSVTAAVFVLLGCVGVGTAYYLFHRAATKIVDSKLGLKDLNSIAKGLGAESQPPAVQPTALRISGKDVVTLDPKKLVTSQDGQCALFTKQELSQVLGTNFTHAESDATGCTYKGDGPREWVRTEALWKGGRKAVQEKKTAYQQLSHNIPKASIPIQPYPEVGDEAWVNLWNVVTACKGTAGVVIDLRYYHDSDDLTKMLTNTALARLQGEKSGPAGGSSRSTR